jgi:TPR repeat protein
MTAIDVQSPLSYKAGPNDASATSKKSSPRPEPFCRACESAVPVLALVIAALIGVGPGTARAAEPQNDDTGDYETAPRVIRPLAEEGDAYAQLAMGMLYYNGWITPQDYVQARKWFNLAASRTPPGADHDAAVTGCDLSAALMTPEQIDEAERLTQEWFFSLERRNGLHP